MAFPLGFPFRSPWITTWKTHGHDAVVDDFVDAAETADNSGVVYRTHFVTIPYMSGQPQPLEIHHCVRFLQMDAHLGEFQLLESSGRVLGTSSRGRLSLTELDTDIAHVLFHCMSRNSVEYQTLHDVYHVTQPGMDLEYIQPLRILFLHAPIAEHTDRIIHIPMWCRIATPWDLHLRTYLPLMKNKRTQHDTVDVATHAVTAGMSSIV
jgi:hypothetical protein